MTMFRNNKKHKMLLLSLMILLLVGAGAVVAFIHTQTDAVKNGFSPSQVTAAIEEDFNGTTKKDVRVANDNEDENIDAFVRAEIVITWKAEDEDGYKTYGIPPAEDDYTLELYEDASWEKGDDGFYYYKKALKPGEKTTPLIQKCSLSDDAQVPEKYYFSVEVIAEAIQATGVDSDGKAPAETAWSNDKTTVTISGSTLDIDNN